LSMSVDVVMLMRGRSEEQLEEVERARV